MAAIMLSDPVLEVARRELRRLSEVKIGVEELQTALKEQVIKREVIDGDKADAARKKVSKAAGKMLRIKKEADDSQQADDGGADASANLKVTSGAAETPPTANLESKN